MIIDILTKKECTDIVNQLSNWEKGRTHLDKSHKDNLEIKNTELNKFIYQKIVSKIQKHTFLKKLCEPRFNMYNVSQKYSKHCDSFMQQGIRTDWSMTLFLVEPDTYEGGELVVEFSGEEKSYKLPAGQMIVYPSGRVHEVLPVTKGTRIAAIAWGESYIRDELERDILYKTLKLLDRPITKDNKSDMIELSFIYNNLLRKWSI